MKAVFGILIIMMAGCATGHPEVDAIQKSCDDPNASQTVINGKTYFCDDYEHFQNFMNAMAKKLHERGI